MADRDEIALKSAKKIAAMWGHNRGHLLAKYQVEILHAIALSDAAENVALKSALGAYEAFHERILCTGQPLEQNGKRIDNTDLNDAHLLAQRVLGK